MPPSASGKRSCPPRTARVRHSGERVALQPDVLRAVCGAGLYLTVVGLLGFGLGAAIRHTAGALPAFFGVLFGLSAIVDLLPTSWRNDIMPYCRPMPAARAFTIDQHATTPFRRGPGSACSASTSSSPSASAWRSSRYATREPADPARSARVQSLSRPLKGDACVGAEASDEFAGRQGFAQLVGLPGPEVNPVRFAGGPPRLA